MFWASSATSAAAWAAKKPLTSLSLGMIVCQYGPKVASLPFHLAQPFQPPLGCPLQPAYLRQILIARRLNRSLSGIFGNPLALYHPTLAPDCQRWKYARARTYERRPPYFRETRPVLTGDDPRTYERRTTYLRETTPVLTGDDSPRKMLKENPLLFLDFV